MISARCESSSDASTCCKACQVSTETFCGRRQDFRKVRSAWMASWRDASSYLPRRKPDQDSIPDSGRSQSCSTPLLAVVMYRNLSFDVGFATRWLQKFDSACRASSLLSVTDRPLRALICSIRRVSAAMPPSGPFCTVSTSSPHSSSRCSPFCSPSVEQSIWKGAVQTPNTESWVRTLSMSRQLANRLSLHLTRQPHSESMFVLD